MHYIVRTTRPPLALTLLAVAGCLQQLIAEVHGSNES